MVRKRKFTEEELSRLEDVKKRADNFDVDFAVRLCVSTMSKMKPNHIIEAVCKWFDAVESICIDAAVRCGDDAITHGDMTIDDAIDSMRVFIEASMINGRIASLLRHAAQADEDGGFGMFTIKQEDIGPKIEELRRALLREKLEMQVRRNRRR